MLNKEEFAELQQEALICQDKTEAVLKFFTNTIEENRLRLGIPSKDYAKLMGFTSRYGYQQMFQAPQKGIGVSLAFPLVQFCLLFGYDLSPSDEMLDRVVVTKADRACLEFASLFAALPKSTLKNIGYLIATDVEIPQEIRQDFRHMIFALIDALFPKEGERDDYLIKYRSKILSPKNRSSSGDSNTESEETEISKEKID